MFPVIAVGAVVTTGILINALKPDSKPTKEGPPKQEKELPTEVASTVPVQYRLVAVDPEEEKVQEEGKAKPKRLTIMEALHKIIV